MPRRRSPDSEAGSAKKGKVAPCLERFPEKNPNPVLRLAADGTVLYRNPAAGKPPWRCEMGQPVPMESLRQLVGQALAAGRTSRQDVELDAFLFAVDIVPFPAENCVNVYGHDITERRQAEKALRDSEHRYRELVQNANSAIIRWRRDGSISFFNEYAQIFFGYTVEEAVGRHVSMLLPETESTGADLSRLIEDIVAHPDRYLHNTNENVRRDGERVWMTWTNRPIFDNQGNLVEILAIGSDITEHKRAEEEFQRNQKTFFELVERAPFGIFVVDSGFCIAQMNISAQLGAFRNVRPIAGHDFTQAMHIMWPDAVAEEIIGRFRHTLATGETYSSQHFSNRRNDVAILESYEWELHRISLPDGRYGVICYYFDSTRLRQTEAALRRSESRWNAAIENFGEGAIIATEEGQLIYWNPAARTMHGFTSEEECIGALKDAAHTFELWTPDGRRLLSMEEWPMLRILRGETVRQLELRLRRLDQSWERMVSYSGAMVETVEGEHLVFLSVYDLTEQRLAEESLRESEAKYRNLFMNMAEEVHFWQVVRDAGGRIKTWRLVAANPPALRTWGRKSLDEIKDKNADEIFGSGAAEHYLPVVEKIMAEGAPYSYEDYFPHLDKYFRFTSVPLDDYFITTGADITGIKKAEMALRQSREDLDRAQAVGQIGWWRLDTRTNVLTWSDENYRIFGVPPGTPMTYDIFMGMVHPDDRQYVDSQWSAAMRGDTYDIEHRIVADGRVKWVREKAYLEFDDHGRLRGGFGICQDITQRKEAEEALQQAVEELQRSNAELQQFAYVASHDLQEPLRMVNSFLKLLDVRYRAQLDDRARKYIGFAVEGATRMSQLVQELLEFSRVETMGSELQPTEAGEALAGALVNLSGVIQEAGAVVTHGALPSVLGDHTQLMQVFQNLIGNAIKFRRSDCQCTVHVSAAREAGQWLFAVRDNGIGISPTAFERIFVIFQRLHTREKYEGTGIGLAICKKIVERHGGRIWVESQVGEGSTFNFTLREVSSL
jgi:PAS domain S-box-containing protein